MNDHEIEQAIYALVAISAVFAVVWAVAYWFNCTPRARSFCRGILGWNFFQLVG